MKTKLSLNCLKYWFQKLNLKPAVAPQANQETLKILIVRSGHHNFLKYILVQLQGLFIKDNIPYEIAILTRQPETLRLDLETRCSTENYLCRDVPLEYPELWSSKIVENCEFVCDSGLNPIKFLKMLKQIRQKKFHLVLLLRKDDRYWGSFFKHYLIATFSGAAIAYDIDYKFMLEDWIPLKTLLFGVELLARPLSLAFYGFSLIISFLVVQLIVFWRKNVLS